VQRPALLPGGAIDAADAAGLTVLMKAALTGDEQRVSVSMKIERIPCFYKHLSRLWRHLGK
jgi:hypothetical protein